MNNQEQYQQIIYEAYLDYSKENFGEWEPGMEFLTTQSFARKCKTDEEFSNKCGLKIEERELLTVDERQKYDPHFDYLIGEYSEHHITLDKRGVPRKITKIIYKDKTVEVYE